LYKKSQGQTEKIIDFIKKIHFGVAAEPNYLYRFFLIKQIIKPHYIKVYLLILCVFAVYAPLKYAKTSCWKLENIFAKSLAILVKLCYHNKYGVVFNFRKGRMLYGRNEACYCI
jgi:hypothetical protein